MPRTSGAVGTLDKFILYAFNLSGMAQPAPIFSRYNSRVRLSPEGQARAIHLLFTEELSVGIVAQRMGVSEPTIYRIRTAHHLKIDKRKFDNGDKRR